MIQAVFDFDAAGVPRGFQLSGHAGYAQSGADIVCASVSSPAYMVANTITEILQLSPQICVREEDGFFSLSLQKAECEAAKDLLNGFFLHLQNLQEQYPEFIEVERGAFNA